MRLSVIIPTRNEAARIADCVAAFQSAVAAGWCEVLVVDNHSTDDTVRQAEAAGARVFTAGPERSAQRNRGAREARGDYLFFVDADMRVPPSTLQEMADRLKGENPPDALYVRERMVGRGFWVTVRDFERSFYDGTCLDGLRVIRRDLFLAVGGYDADLYAGEDWDLDRRLLAAGARVALTQGALEHDEGIFSLCRFLAKKTYYGGNFGRYLRKWNHDAICRRQMGLRYRLWTVFVENGKWRRSLRRPHLLVAVWLLKLLVGLAFAYGLRRSPRPKQLFLLTISYRPEVGGVETRLDLLARSLATRGYGVVVYTYQPIITRRRGPGLERAEGVEIRRIAWFGHDLFHKLERHPFWQALYLVPYLWFRATLYFLPRRRRFDLIHAAGFNAALAARVLSALSGVPFVVSTHSVYRFTPGSRVARLVAWILKGARRVIAVSEESAAELAAIGVPADRLVAPPTWVDLERFQTADDRLAVRASLALPADAFTAIFVGRLKPVKGIALLLAVAERRPDLQFVVVGTGEWEENVREAASRLPNLHYLGFRENAALGPLYRAADVFVLPSQREGFPRTAAESLACGTPVIVPDMAGIKAVLSADVATFIVPSVETVEAALDEWRGRYAREGAMAIRQRARRLAEAQFSAGNLSAILSAYGWEERKACAASPE
jgi:glycosyltransferase involved in cell wall biosynthesis/GT2 family glycosyltransferase